MKCVKLWSISIIMLSTLLQSYPQSMLICEKIIENNVDISIVDKIYKEKNNYLEINVTLPLLQGITNENGQSNLNNTIESWTIMWIDEVKKNVADLFQNGIPPRNPYQLYANYKITNLEDVTSLYIDYYQFTGGAHGITIRKAYSMDNSTGKILTLEDLFKDSYNFKKTIDNEINEQIKKEPDKYFQGSEGFKGIEKKSKFYIKNGDLVIYFDQYEIAPYVSGIPEFVIKKELFEDNINYGKI